MLVFRSGLFGLGLTVKQQQIIDSSFDRSMVQSGGAGVYDPKYAGGFTINQHTWDQVINEVNPGWLSDTLFKTNQYETLRQAWLERVRAVTASLPGCPIGSVTDGGQSCYFGRFTPLATWNPMDPIELLPPGVFAVYAIPFSANEISGGRFIRTLVPTTIQRREAEWAIIRQSQIRFFGHIQLINRPAIGKTSGMLWKSLNAFEKRGSMTMPSGGGFTTTITPAQTREIVAHPSVDQVLAIVPDVMIFSINFERNPIQPNPDERTKPGGWAAWIARGGFPLSREVVTGKASTSDAIGLQVCAGPLCACPGGSGFPACVPAAFNKSGIGSTPSEGSFYPYVAIPQGVVKREIQLSLVHNDPAWITRVGEVGARFMDALAGTLCANQGITKEQIKSQMASEECLDAAKKPCAKGSPGCVCTKASSTTSSTGAKVSAYVVWDIAMSKFCPDWAAGQINQLDLLPPVDPNPPIPEQPSKIPWWAVVGGGLLVGAGALSFLGPAKRP